MRGLPIAVTLALGGCLSQGVGPGVLNPHWQEPRRDPDPTRDPTAEQTTSPWVPEGEGAAADTLAEDLAKRALATAAAVLAAGWLPMLVWYGRFEEDPNARRQHRAGERAADDEDAAE